MGFDWTGLYIGAHGGFMWGEADASPGEDTDPEGPFGGINAGYLWAAAPWVFGIGADVSLGDIDDDVTVGATSTEQEFGLFGSVHGRLGYAFDRFLIYGLGGIAIADGEREVGAVSDDQIHVGWVAGGGVEFALTDMFTLFAEYRHWDFGEQDYGLAVSQDVDFDADSVMGGVRILF